MKTDYTKKGVSDDYLPILADIQQMQTDTFWQITSRQTDGFSTNQKSLFLPYIEKRIADKGYHLENHDATELCEKLYNDTQGYSILTRPLDDPCVEGIHVNAWNNVRLQFTDGSSMQIDGFHSPGQAIDIVRRILQHSGQTLDDAVPVAEGSLNANVRITAVKSPIVDPEVGVACYIRKLARRTFLESDYLSGDFADSRELQLLRTALRRGVSILLVGKVNTGKTTFLSYLLSTLPKENEIISIEAGARELKLAGTDNNVIHMLARESKEPGQNITQELLVEKILRMNVDDAAVAEMRNIEAYAAQEASLSGHVVISTTHAGNPRQAHKRIANLCRKKYATDFSTALEQACEAFPLVVFIHTLEDKKRRIMAITECVVEDGKISYLPLWKYCISENSTGQDGLVKIVGEHKQVGNPSVSMCEKMQMYGISRPELELLQMPATHEKGDAICS